MNPECNNYKQELDSHIEICPLCGKQAEIKETSLDKRRPIGVAVSIIAVAAFLVTLMPIPSWIPFILGIVVSAACIVTSIIIRMTAAIIVSILSAAAVVGMLFFYGAL